MNEFIYTVTDENGIHARPAGLLVRFAKETADRITVTKGEKSADATKLFALMGLSAKKGDTLVFTVSGENAEATAYKLREFCVKNL